MVACTFCTALSMFSFFVLLVRCFFLSAGFFVLLAGFFVFYQDSLSFCQDSSPFNRILCPLGRILCPLGTILCLVGTIFCPFLHRQLFARPPCSSWVSSWRTPTCISWSWITGCCSTVCVAQRPPGPLWTAARMASRQRRFLLVCPTSLGSLTTDVLSLPKVSLAQRLAVRCGNLPQCIVHGLDGWSLVLLLHSG